MSGIIVGGTLRGADKLERKIQAAFEAWASEDINDDYWDEQFKSRKWDYDNRTRRKNGELVEPGKRDIYDLGELYESGKRNFKIEKNGNGILASWLWDAQNSSGGAYAWYVHEGHGTNIEPRQWTDELQQPIRFEASDLKKALLTKIKAAMAKQ